MNVKRINIALVTLLTLLILLANAEKGQAIDYGKGSITIDYYTKIYTNRITGDKERSYLESGFQGYNELMINLEHHLSDKSTISGYLEGIQTSDKNENDKEFALRNFYVRLLKEGKVDLTLGDFAASFTQYSLGTSLLGFKAKVSPVEHLKIWAIAAKNRERTTYGVGDDYRRYTQGGRLEIDFFKGACKVGASFVNTEVDPSSLHTNTGVQPYSNQVASIDADLRFLSDAIQIQGEVARSRYDSNRDNPIVEAEYDNAYRLKVEVIPWQPLSLYVSWERVEPKFSTVLGSAYADNDQTQVGFTLTPAEWLEITGYYLRQYDNIDNNKDYRSLSWTEDLSVTLSPFFFLKNFLQQMSLTIHGSRQDSYSRDHPRSTDTRDKAIDITLSQPIWKLNLSLSMENRWFKDHTDSTQDSRTEAYTGSISSNFDLLGVSWGLSLSEKYQVDETNYERGSAEDLSTSLALSAFYQKTGTNLSLSWVQQDSDMGDPSANTLTTSFTASLRQELQKLLKIQGEIELKYIYVNHNVEEDTYDYKEQTLFLGLKVSF
ncbi:MAG: hypothetical protein DRI91_02755 [Aquificota bacterium]|nr:MAG: hypothetical protein DRI91_02755 [Aquificota bacterium]